jgi:uncharacterized protein YjbJ (UPF0337 family)
MNMKECVMNEKIDETAGKVKEAAGILTGDEELEREGKSEQTLAKAKGAVQDVADSVKKVVDKVEEKLTEK